MNDSQKSLKIGQLYTFPKSYTFLFMEYDLVIKHIGFVRRNREDAIREFNSRNIFIIEMDAAIADNPKNNSFFKLDFEASYFLPYRPFMLLEYHSKRLFNSTEVFFLKILVEEKVFWTFVYSCLFDFDVISEYTCDMIEKTVEDSLKLFNE